MRPILLEIVSKVLTTFNQCRHCEILFDEAEAGLDRKFHQKEINEYPSDLKEEYIKLSDWIRELRHLYKHRLLIKLIDIQSPLGIYIKPFVTGFESIPPLLLRERRPMPAGIRTISKVSWINISRIRSHQNIEAFSLLFLEGVIQIDCRNFIDWRPLRIFRWQ
jgi:hypothetical protein